MQPPVAAPHPRLGRWEMRTVLCSAAAAALCWSTHATAAGDLPAIARADNATEFLELNGYGPAVRALSDQIVANWLSSLRYSGAARLQERRWAEAAVALAARELRSEVETLVRELWSDEDLQQSVAFLRTPAGQKFLTRTPAFHARLSPLFEEWTTTTSAILERGNKP